MNDTLLANGDNLLRHLNIVRMRARFLPARHPSVQQMISETVRFMTDLLQGTASLTLIMRGNEFYFNGRRLPKESLRYTALLEAFEAIDVSSVVFGRGLDDAELTRFVDTCFVPIPGDIGHSQAKALIRNKPFTHIRLNQEELAHAIRDDIQGPEGSVLSLARDAYRQAIRATVEAQHDGLHGGKINVMLTLRVVDMLQEGITNNPEAYFALSQLREFSEYTYYHSVNVAIISMLLGKGVGLDWEAVRRLGLAAMLHDLGKIYIPTEILEKPGRLDDRERTAIESHPLDSVRILLEQKEMFPAALAVAAQHHAGYDLGGYPDLKGFGSLHLFSHITTIADVYDALRSARSYKPAMLPDKSMEILLSGQGKAFHPILLKAFFRMVGFYPVGSTVELNTGELAIVTSTNQQAPLEPQVKIIDGPNSVAGDQVVNLHDLNSFGEHSRQIIRSVDPVDFGIRVADYL